MLRALKRYDEAAQTLEHAVIDGAPRIVDFETLCDILLMDLNRPERVVALCRALDVVPLMVKGTLALAFFQLGEHTEAVKLLKTPVDKLRALWRTKITAFAKKRKLDASALLAKL